MVAVVLVEMRIVRPCVEAQPNLALGDGPAACPVEQSGSDFATRVCASYCHSMDVERGFGSIVLS